MYPQIDRPAAVLFDMDGTLLDSEPLWDISLRDLAARLGGALSPDARRAIVGSNIHDAVSIVYDDLGIHGDRLESADWLLARTEEVFATGVAWISGAREFVQALRDVGIPRALVTSTYRRLTKVALQSLPEGMFDTIVCGDEVSRPKPDPDCYLSAAQALGVAAEDCVAVEDSPRGVAAAQAARCAVVVVGGAPVPPAPRQLAVGSIGQLTLAQLGSLATTGAVASPPR